MTDFDDYLALVRRLGAGGINRSENDLSSNLKNALASFGLFGVIDTGSGGNRAKRPDIALYVHRDAADVGASADVVVESKKPAELAAYSTLEDALVGDWLWNDKFVPYVSAHADRITFFILTTFDRLTAVRVDRELRASIQTRGSYGREQDRRHAIRNSVSFDLSADAEAERFRSWCEGNLNGATLQPPPLSSVSDIRAIDSVGALELFASDLADIVVGPEGRSSSTGTLVNSIDVGGEHLDSLAPEVQRGLVVYTMAAHGGMSVDAAQAYIEDHWKDELGEFVSASVHSLIGRLFAMKAIEDGFCVATEPPLLPQSAWVFHTDRFDDLDLAELPESFFSALAGLADVENPAVKDLAATGRFYDWLGPQLDPAAFRRLLTMFFSHNFARLDEDLLGRFFELYAQRVDRRRRKQLGQYYTPLPIIRHMWRLAMAIAAERGVTNQLFALDPGVGSGTFLIEGANALHAAGIPRFWERLHGFDISPQAIGIAQINVYLAVLAHLDRHEAEAVGNLHLYPTDALDPRNGARLRTIMPLLADDSTRAFLRNRIDLSETVKQRSRFPLVIGNPPYRNNSDQTLAQVAERFPPLLRSSRANARARKRNIRDDYAWFFAAADHYVGDRGVIAFVVSDSFCYASSYRFFREDLLRRYLVRHLIVLGASVFRDVGPRTQFVIVVLERRVEDLARADDAGPIPVTDLRSLGGDLAPWGTDDDPRLHALDTGRLPPAVDHQPTRQRNFTLFPSSEVVARVESFPNVLHGDNPRRVFKKKWPGLITAFDELFRGETRAAVTSKIQQFMAAVAITDVGTREAALDEFAQSIRATSEKNRGRLSLMAADAAEARMVFEADRVRRVITGGAPNDATWYPDERLQSWVYYEPRLRIPRNVLEGKDPGYGTMSQWRDPESHTIDPKLVFTTGTNPDYGLKALVVPGDWMVKLHGGESQQFHYTGLNNPLAQLALSGPNNLGDDAHQFHAALTDAGFGDEDFLMYLAGIYNSEIAEDYLESGLSSALRIPLVIADVESGAAARVIHPARTLRDLHWLAAEAAEGLPAEIAEALANRESLLEFGFVEDTGSGGRFRQRRRWQGGEDTLIRLNDAIVSMRPVLDEAVHNLFYR